MLLALKMEKSLGHMPRLLYQLGKAKKWNFLQSLQNAHCLTNTLVIGDLRASDFLNNKILNLYYFKPLCNLGNKGKLI
jgi:hypothetical protein